MNKKHEMEKKNDRKKRKGGKEEKSGKRRKKGKKKKQGKRRKKGKEKRRKKLKRGKKGKKEVRVCRCPVCMLLHLGRGKGWEARQFLYSATFAFEVIHTVYLPLIQQLWFSNHFHQS